MRVVGSVIALLLALLPAFGAEAASQANLLQLESQLHQVHLNLVNDRARIATVTQQVQVTSAQLAAVNGQISNTQYGINLTQSNIRVTQTHISVTRVHLSHTMQNIRREQSRLDTVLIFAEQQGVVGYLSVLLHVSNFNDFVGRLGLLASVSTYERGLIHHLSVQESAIHRDLNLLASTRRTLVRQKATLVTQHNQLSQVATQRATVLAQLTSEQSSLASLEQDLVNQGTQLWSAIQAIEAELASGQLSWSQILSIVQSISVFYNIDPYLVLAVIHQESGGNSKAVSSAGAEGLMQLMPQTAADLGVSNAFNPQQNIKGGIAYLAYLLKLFKGNVAWALAGYNAGPGAVEYYHGIPPYPETQNYVKDVMWFYQHGM